MLKSGSAKAAHSYPQPRSKKTDFPLKCAPPYWGKLKILKELPDSVYVKMRDSTSAIVAAHGKRSARWSQATLAPYRRPEQEKNEFDNFDIH